jgi:hypothetical protein
MFREQIREHARWVKQTLEEHPDIANFEERTKGSLIDPLLRCLGYDPNDPGQVRREAGIRNKRVDYMLIGETAAKIAVEAKSAKTVLSDKVIDQLDGYFHHSDAVAGVLTNGIEYWLFTDLDKTNVMDSQPYHRVNITDPGDITENDIHHLQALAKSQIQQHIIRHKAQQERNRKLVNRIVDGELRSPSQEFLKLVGRKAGIKPLTKASVEDLQPLVMEAINLSRSKGVAQPRALHPDTSASNDPPEEDGVLPTLKSASDPPDPIGAGKKAALTKSQFKGARLFGKPLLADNYRDVLTSVVAELQLQHPNHFRERVRKAPFVKSTRKWQYISEDKNELSPLHQMHKVGDYFVDTNLSADRKVARARLFLKEFGHSPEDLVIHTSD